MNPSDMVVFENRDMIVINKPSGLLSVPGRGDDKQDCAITRVQTLAPSALVVHRLDMSTSGLLLFAKGAQPSNWRGRVMIFLRL